MKKGSVLLKNQSKFILVFFLSAFLFISGCGSTTDTPQDIITLKPTEKGRTQIKVLVKHAFSLDGFEKIVEEKFPDMDLVQVGDYTANAFLSRGIEARIKHDDLEDMVFTWPYGIGEEYWKDRLIDLSAFPFSSTYNLSMLDELALDDGSLYFLPGPASIRGIIYNKTLFEENGWNVPQNYDEFTALCATIEESGMRAFQLPLRNAEVLDTSFIAFNYGSAYSKPADKEWLSLYNEGEGSFLEHFDTEIDTFLDLVDKNILRASDLELNYSYTQKNLFTRKTAMTEDGALLAYTGKEVANSKDEFAVMPFFTRNPQSDWARIYMTCYIGLSKHLEEAGNEEKYEKVLKLMEFISSEEGQEALSSENGAMYSSLKNVSTPAVSELADMQDALAQGRYGSFPTFKRSENAFHEGIRGLLRKEITKEEFANMVDAENKNPPLKKKAKVLGEASDDFTLIDTGSFVSDILREKTKSGFALFLDEGKDGTTKGRGIAAKLYKGKVTEEDVERIFPGLRYGELGLLQNVTMRGENIINTLEYKIPIENHKDGFYYFSGLKVKFNPLAKKGKRIQEISDIHGKKIKKDKLYTVAIMQYSVPEEYIEEVSDTGIVIKDLLKEEIARKKKISPSKDERFVIVE